MQIRIQHLERENKALEVRYSAEASDLMRVREEEFAHEQRKLTLKVKEAEKRLEIMKINNEERMNLALDAKDKDKHRLVD